MRHGMQTIRDPNPLAPCRRWRWHGSLHGQRYGATLAVDGLSFTVRPGLVTGFLGRNGAGMITTMRLILGLDRPAGGEATLGGRRYRDLGT